MVMGNRFPIEGKITFTLVAVGDGVQIPQGPDKKKINRARR